MGLGRKAGEGGRGYRVVYRELLLLLQLVELAAVVAVA